MKSQNPQIILIFSFLSKPQGFRFREENFSSLCILSSLHYWSLIPAIVTRNLHHQSYLLVIPVPLSLLFNTTHLPNFCTISTSCFTYCQFFSSRFNCLVIFGSYHLLFFTIIDIFFRKDLHPITIFTIGFYCCRFAFSFFLLISSPVFVVDLCSSFCHRLMLHLFLLAFFLVSSFSCSCVCVLFIIGSLLWQPLFLFVQVCLSSTGCACQYV